MGIFIDIRNALFGVLYRGVIKPLLFLRDPEDVHDGAVALGKFFGRFALTRALTRLCFGYSHPMLLQNIHGVTFANPVGLAAGFDKNAVLVNIIGNVGFGYAEVGSVTGEPCAGNPRPRLWRLKNTRALCVYYGLKNDGAEQVAERVVRAKRTTPVGISIAKTNDESTVDTGAGIADYAKAFRASVSTADYITINISCPNTFGGDPFHNPALFERLLSVLPISNTEKPVFFKISPDISLAQVDALCALAKRRGIAGVIVGNLSKDRTTIKHSINPKDTLPEKGGIGGPSIRKKSLALVRHIRETQGNNFIIIGCGGISSADDAYEYILAGASLLQLITGMIYEGPQLISEINHGLVRRLKRDGFKNISEAVGGE